MNAIVKKTVFLSLALAANQMTLAGFGLETTRIVYAEKDRNQSVVAFNTDSKTSYLAQSWIDNEKNKLSPDFIATPPILKLRPEQKNTIQITKNAILKSEQESLYWLNVRFIAPTPKDSDNTLNLFMTHRIKLIYRPTALTQFNIDDEVKKLTWQIKGDQLLLKNPTAFYINLAKVEIEQKEVTTESYVAPFSELSTKLTTAYQPQAKVDLTYINDYGKAILLQP